MMTTDEIVNEIKKLPPGGWEKIKDCVENGKDIAKPRMSEEEFAQYLLATGVIKNIPSGETDAEFEDYELIDVGGESLSEMIIRERR